jgi:hypothetical protein
MPSRLLRWCMYDMPSAAHGGRALALEDEEGAIAPPNPLALARLLKQAGVRLVVLNACETEHQARLLLKEGVSFVIGTRSALSDQAAAEYARAFYDYIFNTCTLELHRANPGGGCLPSITSHAAAIDQFRCLLTSLPDTRAAPPPILPPRAAPPPLSPPHAQYPPRRSKSRLTSMGCSPCG